MGASGPPVSRIQQATGFCRTPWVLKINIGCQHFEIKLSEKTQMCLSPLKEVSLQQRAHLPTRRWRKQEVCGKHQPLRRRALLKALGTWQGTEETMQPNTVHIPGGKHSGRGETESKPEGRGYGRKQRRGKRGAVVRGGEGSRFKQGGPRKKETPHV